ncbi:MAG: hypothetical protein JWN03_5683 [Nocardia sp.]|uniref:hypothetical protein n=1 Tax=Nocardia sp. TaxID=1821 RepID=UPI0026151768|nr:hypothetical protein [Nocardia sp.]MCU1645408.1 hypothetical protein [Nocardia sp.]
MNSDNAYRAGVSSIGDGQWAVDVCRERVRRASEIRAEIGAEWARHLTDHPRRFDVVRGDTDTSWTFVVETLTPMPVRLSALFGEWLYELRAALDGIVYYLAVRDSGQNPPPAERGIFFPVFTDPAKYDDTNHRGRMKALSDESFALLRQVQPFNAQPDHGSNVLWWLEELARIDRHRQGHALAPHIEKIKIGHRKPLQPVGGILAEAHKLIPIDESVPTPILNLESPAGWEAQQVRDHLDITEAITSRLDVTEWVRNSTAPMKSLELSQRMVRCEQFVLEVVINPLATGNI